MGPESKFQVECFTMGRFAFCLSIDSSSAKVAVQHRPSWHLRPSIDSASCHFWAWSLLVFAQLFVELSPKSRPWHQNLWLWSRMTCCCFLQVGSVAFLWYPACFRSLLGIWVASAADPGWGSERPRRSLYHWLWRTGFLWWWSRMHEFAEICPLLRPSKTKTRIQSA